MSEELAEESEEFEYPTLSNASWGVDISQNQPKPIYVYRGETRTCTIYHRQNGSAIDTSDPSATATLLYQQLGMGNAWYEIPCTLSDDGVATFVWTPLHDNGADQYLYYLQISVLNYDPEVPEGEVADIIYRANGNIVMEYAPGIAPNHITYPITYLDFAVTPYTNAPWALQSATYTKSETDNLLDDKAPISHISDFDNPHNVTAAQAGAMSVSDGAALTNRVATVEGDVDSLEVINAKIAQYGTSDITITNPLAFGFDGAGTITSYDFDLGGAEVVIPYEINGISVTAIGDFAFSDAYTWIGDPITSVIAPKSITTIGNSAFAGCESLTSVSFPSVTSIAEFAFMGCSSLASVSLQSSTTIGNSAFGGCVKLTSVSFPSATSISDNAFAGCVKLTSVSFSSATSIGYNAFAGCESLTSVSFPSVTSISDNAFGGCVKLTSVSFPSATSISDYAFYGCESLTSVFYGSNKPTSTESIYDSAPNVTNYVLTGTTGWGSTFPASGDYQRPVVMVDNFDYITKTIYANTVKAKSVIINGINLTDSLAAKADNVTVTALAATVATKADNSTVCDLATTVAAKADSSTVTTLSTTVATKADKALAYTTLSGTAVTVNPSASYTWTASGTCTITASGWTSGNDESCSIILTKEAGATISGSGVTIMDTPSVGVNYCFIRNLPDGAKFFVSYLE